jgi:hypothetical protein
MIKLIRLVLLCRKYGHARGDGFIRSTLACNDWYYVCVRCGRVVVVPLSDF